MFTGLKNKAKVLTFAHPYVEFSMRCDMTVAWSTWPFRVYVLMSLSSRQIPLFGNRSQCYAPACRPLNSPSLVCWTYHWTPARPTQVCFAAAQCLYPLPSFFPPFHSSNCPWYLFSSISSITSQYMSSALGNVHEMLDKLLTQRIFSVST